MAVAVFRDALQHRAPMDWCVARPRVSVQRVLRRLNAPLAMGSSVLMGSAEHVRRAQSAVTGLRFAVQGVVLPVPPTLSAVRIEHVMGVSVNLSSAGVSGIVPWGWVSVP